MYALISDVHLHNWSMFASANERGENTRLRIILDEIRNVANQLVHKQPSQRHLYIAGDLFHVRGKISPSVLNPTLALFTELRTSPYCIDIRIIPGNHDLESKDSHALTNATQALSALGCIVCNKPTIFGDDRVTMLPWYDKLDDLRAEITNVYNEIINRGLDPIAFDLIIHAPLNGVIKGLPDTGLTPEELFEFGFKRVFCGHYHNHKVFTNESGEQVISVGALTHQTWGDVGAEFGGLLIDQAIHRVDSSAPRFIHFDLNWDEDEAEIMCAGNYIKVKLEEATESEIKALREQLKDWGALGSVIDAKPKAKAATRQASVSAGASLAVSVSDWIKGNPTAGVDENAVQVECEDVLKSIAEVA